MNQAQIDQLILKYLEKRGLKDISSQLQQSLTNNSDFDLQQIFQDYIPELPLEHGLLLQLISDKDSKKYLTQQFWQLVDWVDHSLEQYKVEFQYILYPILVHVYLHLVAQNLIYDSKQLLEDYNNLESTATNRNAAIGREQELKELRQITSLQQVSSNKVSVAALRNRYKVKMTPFAYSIFMEYLQRNKVWGILALVNQYIEIQISNADEVKAQEQLQSQLLTPIDSSQLSKVNNLPVRLELLESSFTVRYIRDMFQKQNLQNQVDQNQPKMEVDQKKANDQTQQPKPEVPNQGAQPDSNQKQMQQGDQSGTEEGQAQDKNQVRSIKQWRSYRRQNMVENTIKSKTSSVPIQKMPPNVEHHIYQEILKQDLIDELNLPSILYLTMNNSDGDINCCKFLDDASMWLGGQADGSLLLYYLKQQEVTLKDPNDGLIKSQISKGDTKILHGHKGPIFALDTVASRDYAFTASGDGTVGLWSLKLQSKITQYKGHMYSVWDVQACPNSVNYFASGAADRTVRIWSTERSQALRIFSGHSQDVEVVQWHPNCQYVFSASQDNTIHMWDCATGRIARVFEGISEDTSVLRVSRDGQYLVSGTGGGSIIVYDIRQGTKICEQSNAHNGQPIWSMDFSLTDGAILASGGADCQVKLWNMKEQDKKLNLSNLNTYNINPVPIHSLQFSSTNLLLGSGAV